MSWHGRYFGARRQPFIVRGPLPDRELALALVRHWSLIQIGAIHRVGSIDGISFPRIPRELEVGGRRTRRP